VSQARAWRLLTVREFRLLWIANGLYFAALQIVLLSGQWFILDVGGSNTTVGLAALIQGAVVMLFTTFGGVLADRSERRNLLIIGRLGLALPCVFMAGTTFLGIATMWHVLWCAAALGLFSALSLPVSATFILDVVSHRHITSAIALNASSQGLFAVAGPAIGGVAIASLGVAGSYAIGAFGFVVGIAFVAMIQVRGRPVPSVRAGVWSDVVKGMRYVMRSPLNLWLAGFALAPLFGAFTAVLRPVYAREILDVGAAGLGMLGVAFGAGALVSLSFMIFFLERIQRMGLALLFVHTQWVIGNMVFALSTDFTVSLVSQFFLGMVGPVWLAMIQTMVQTSAPAK
jgi:MFS family permease